jgi:hypothetical protein|tara:strand:+ start:2208 stop:5330 length:3123 start_codon:yes stop_codon:yes gene_type:complete
MAKSKFLEPNYLESTKDSLILEEREKGIGSGPPTQEEIETLGYDQAVLNSYGLDGESIKKGYQLEAEEFGNFVYQSANEIWLEQTAGKQGEMPPDFVTNEMLADIMKEYEPSKDVRLLKLGISNQGMGFETARFFYEAGGMNNDVKKDNLERYLKIANPDKQVSVMFASELGGDNKEFLNTILGTDNLDALNYDPVIYKVGDEPFRVVNTPGLDKGDFQFLMRELPVIAFDVLGAGVGTKVGGFPGLIAGSAAGSAIGELLVQVATDSYLHFKETGDIYTYEDFMERVDEISGTMGKQALFAGIATPVFKLMFDGIMAAIQKSAGKRMPASMDKLDKQALEDAPKRISNKAIEEINNEMTKLYGDISPQIRLTLAKYLGEPYLVAMENFIKKSPSQRSTFVDEMNKNQKEAMEVIDLYLGTAKSKPVGTPSIGDLGETVVSGAQKVSDDAIFPINAQILDDTSKLNLILDSFEASAQGNKISREFVENLDKTNRELYQAEKTKYDTVVNNILKNLEGGPNVSFVKTGTLRRDLIELRKSLNAALVNADEGTIKIINQILDATAGTKKAGTPGIPKAKDLNFNQVMSTLNGLNRLIDDDYARLAGNAPDSKTLVAIAAKTRTALLDSLQKNLSPEDYFTLNSALTNLSEIRKTYNNKAINMLFKTSPNKLNLEVSDKAVLNTILNDEVASRELLGLLDNPSLVSQKEVVKRYIKNNYKSFVTNNGNITDAGTLAKNTKTWMSKNEYLLEYFNKEEKKLFENAIRFMDNIKFNQKQLDDLTKSLRDNGIEGLKNVDPYTINSYLQKNPSMVGVLVESLQSNNSQLAKQTLENVKDFYNAELRNKIIKPDIYTGTEFFSASAISNFLKSSDRGIYEMLFGKKYIEKLDKARLALDPYESLISSDGLNVLSTSQVQQGLKNTFFGQLDRKRTILRGLTTLLKLRSFNDTAIPLANVDEFFRRYKSNLNQPEYIKAMIAAATQEPIVTGMEEKGEMNLGEMSLKKGGEVAGTGVAITTEKVLPVFNKIIKDILNTGGTTVVNPPE